MASVFDNEQLWYKVRIVVRDKITGARLMTTDFIIAFRGNDFIY
jgi:hypothetical protein